MRWSVFFIAVGSACYAPRLHAGAPCVTDSDCPVEQRCIAEMCGGTPFVTDAALDDVAMLPDGTPSDLDGDGIANESDNCPTVPNVDQANEDGDKLGDACDPCPIFANDTPSDPDGDQVSDVCDPNPNTPGDRIVLFEGFHHGVPASWHIIGSASQVGDDVSLVASSGMQASTLTPPLAAPGHATITTHVAATALVSHNDGGEQDAELAVGMPFDATAGIGQGILCELYSPVAQSATNRNVDIFNTNANAEVVGQPLAWQTNVGYTMTYTRTGTSYRCVVQPDGGSPVSVSGTATYVPGQQNLSLYAYEATARISYLLIVTSP